MRTSITTPPATICAHHCCGLPGTDLIHDPFVSGSHEVEAPALTTLQQQADYVRDGVVRQGTLHNGHVWGLGYLMSEVRSIGEYPSCTLARAQAVVLGIEQGLAELDRRALAAAGAGAA